MPEGPEVRVMADQLSKMLIGKKMVEISFDQKSKCSREKITQGKRFLLLQEINPQPSKVVDVTSDGKTLIFWFENGHALTTGLGMEGRWLESPTKHSNAWITFEDQSRIYFDDSRHFGNLRYYTSEAAVVADLDDLHGPDILAEEVPEEEWRRIFRRYPRREICSALMDQKIVAGIGNYLKSEILYEARIRPDRKISELSDDQLELLREISHRLIRQSYAAQGLSIRTYLAPDGTKGTFQLAVYKRSCDDRGNPVITGVFSDKRTTHWVPTVQL